MAACAKRREKISMTEGYSSNLDKLEQEIAIQKLERSIPSDPSIRKWIDEFNDLRDVDKYKMEQISEEWDGFTMPEGYQYLLRKFDAIQAVV
ncbi:MAG: hypothetical protein CM1200mP37_5950 [Chloroflexota bacterium]|nr:MAG: hypothetical protein CM1200mP37_5950 [Chloroflexota bacterium]